VGGAPDGLNVEETVLFEREVGKAQKVVADLHKIVCVVQLPSPLRSHTHISCLTQTLTLLYTVACPATNAAILYAAYATRTGCQRIWRSHTS
jgi:hypothetical protein